MAYNQALRRFHFGPNHKYGSGNHTGITMDNSGRCVTVEENDGNLYYRVGRLEPLENKARFNEKKRYGAGSTNHIAMNDFGHCIEVHTKSGFLYFRMGMITPDFQEIHFGQETQYGAGTFNAISLDNLGNCLEVHVNHGQLGYTLGKVSFSKKTIDFSQPKVYGTGTRNQIAVNNHFQCVESHVDNGRLYFQVGQFDPENRTLTFGSKTQHGTADTHAVSLNDNLHCLAVHTSGGSLFYRKGTVDFHHRSIKFTDPEKYAKGSVNAISFNNLGQVAETHVAENLLFSCASQNTCSFNLDRSPKIHFFIKDGKLFYKVAKNKEKAMDNHLYTHGPAFLSHHHKLREIVVIYFRKINSNLFMVCRFGLLHAIAGDITWGPRIPSKHLLNEVPFFYRKIRCHPPKSEKNRVDVTLSLRDGGSFKPFSLSASTRRIWKRPVLIICLNHESAQVCASPPMKPGAEIWIETKKDWLESLRHLPHPIIDFSTSPRKEECHGRSYLVYQVNRDPGESVTWFNLTKSSPSRYSLAVAKYGLEKVFFKIEEIDDQVVMMPQIWLKPSEELLITRIGTADKVKFNDSACNLDQGFDAREVAIPKNLVLRIKNTNSICCAMPEDQTDEASPVGQSQMGEEADIVILDDPDNDNTT